MAESDCCSSMRLAEFAIVPTSHPRQPSFGKMLRDHQFGSVVVRFPDSSAAAPDGPTCEVRFSSVAQTLMAAADAVPSTAATTMLSIHFIPAEPSSCRQIAQCSSFPTELAISSLLHWSAAIALTLSGHRLETCHSYTRNCRRRCSNCASSSVHNR